MFQIFLLHGFFFFGSLTIFLNICVIIPMNLWLMPFSRMCWVLKDLWRLTLLFGYWFLGDSILYTIMLGFLFMGSLSPNLCDLCIFELIFQILILLLLFKFCAHDSWIKICLHVTYIKKICLHVLLNLENNMNYYYF